jgi:hypothetical protein
LLDDARQAIGTAVTELPRDRLDSTLGIRTATTTPDAAVRSPIAVIATDILNASASTPASNAPTA